MAKEITQPTEEQIRTRAYYLWEADGCPQGRDWDYWIKAKHELDVKPATAAKKSSIASNGTSVPKRRNNTKVAVYA